MRDASGTIFLALSFYYIKEALPATCENRLKSSFLPKNGCKTFKIDWLLRFGYEIYILLRFQVFPVQRKAENPCFRQSDGRICPLKWPKIGDCGSYKLKRVTLWGLVHSSDGLPDGCKRVFWLVDRLLRDASGTIFLALSFYYIKEALPATCENRLKSSFLPKNGCKTFKIDWLLRFEYEIYILLRFQVFPAQKRLKIPIFGNLMGEFAP